MRLVERAQADPAWGLEYEDETWFVWVPPQGIMNPEAGLIGAATFANEFAR